MTTQTAELDRPVAGILHLHTAQRLIGLMGGIAILAVIALGVWGLRKLDEAARTRKPATAGTVNVAGENAASIIPPIPTFVTAALINPDDPEPQEEEQPRSVEPKPLVPDETPSTDPLPTKPPAKIKTNLKPFYGEPNGFEEPLGVIDYLPILKLPVLRRIRAPRDAVVKSIQVKEDQVVKKGDLLIVLTSETVEWQMIEVRGQLESAEAKLAVLDQKRQNVQRLIQQNAASQEEFAALQAEVQVAQAELKTRKSQYDLITRAQSELNILAPVDGKVHAPDLEANLLGNPVHRGELLLEIIAADGADGTKKR